jgi:Zn-dependent M28 family amino/carboxypeptidase
VSNNPYASAPGTDDNASVVAVMMEDAYVMSLHDWNRTLIFIAFSGEEIGFIGSSTWAKENEDLLKNVVGESAVL